MINKKLLSSIRSSPNTMLWRKSVLERDGFRCCECHNVGGNLHVHHIKSLVKLIMVSKIYTLEDAYKCSALWDTNNGVTLCASCHLSHHPKMSFVSLNLNRGATSKLRWKKASFGTIAKVLKDGGDINKYIDSLSTEELFNIVSKFPRSKKDVLTSDTLLLLIDLKDKLLSINNNRLPYNLNSKPKPNYANIHKKP